MIVLIVRMTVKPGGEEECVRLCRLMSEESRKEPGCLQWMAHQSKEDPRCFVLYEEYVDEAALDLHRASPHFAQYIRGGVDDLVESRSRELFVPLT
jgi:quinol monooxygenase YgiN